MPVVINEFEVVPAPPPGTPNPSPNNATTAPPPALTPWELERLLQREVERTLRLWAH